MTCRELIPKGTRFGPLVGDSYTNEILLKDADRKYFWRVSEEHASLWICVLSCEISLCVHFKTLHILYLHAEAMMWQWRGMRKRS